MLQSMGSQRVGYDWATELNNKHVIKAVKAYEQPSELSTETDCKGSICPRQLWQSPAAMRRALGPFLFRLKKEHLLGPLGAQAIAARQLCSPQVYIPLYSEAQVTRETQL